MPRFVLLYHDCPAGHPRPSHWDLMLEQEGMLRTWALAQLPQDWRPLVDETEAVRRAACPAAAASNTVSAESLGDHRPAYLDYEGPVSDDRGEVMRIESGTFEPQSEAADCWEVAITGRSLSGRITLSRAPSAGTAWQLVYSA